MDDLNFWLNTSESEKDFCLSVQLIDKVFGIPFVEKHTPIEGVKVRGSLSFASSGEILVVDLEEIDGSLYDQFL